MKKVFTYIIPIAICFVLGFIASGLQGEAIVHWYPYLTKSELTPPNWVFPIVWSLIYLLSGISAGRVWNKGGALRNGVLWLWGVQQCFNFSWSIMFFMLQSPLLGFINIIVLDVLVMWYVIAAWKVSKAASVLFWLYLLWIGFASFLNVYIMVCN